MVPKDAIEKYFAKHGFFHFTDDRNIPSIIAADGLLSRRELTTRQISPIAPGGNEWSRTADDAFGLDAYVHLCLTNEHPMEYLARRDGRIVTSRFLNIGAEVLAVDDIRFTTEVSNKCL